MREDGLLKGAAYCSMVMLALFCEIIALLTWPIVCLDNFFSTGFIDFM